MKCTIAPRGNTTSVRTLLFASVEFFPGKYILRHFLLVAMTSLVMACSGGSNETARTEREPPDVTTATKSNDAEALAEADARQLASISQTFYSRPYDYPRSVNLPLQFVSMSTGKKLSVRVTLPADEQGNPAPGPFPVILTQAAYNTNLLSLLFAGSPGNLMMGTPDYFMVRRGYAQVAVDTLGTGASEGGWELLGEEEQIGFADMVDWVHQQPWCNGKLGVAGVSYMAISSLFAAERRPDSIDAVFASLPMGDAMRGIVGTGGLVNAHFMRTWMMITEVLSTQNIPAMLAYPQHMNQLMRSTQDHVDQIDAFYLPLIDDALWNEPYVTYDGPFWRTRSPIENIDKIKAPTFILGALHDLFQRDEPLLYERLRQNGVDARLVMYDGTHFQNFLMPHIGNAQVPPIDYLLLQWFDHYLKGMETGTDTIPSVVQHIKNYPTASTPEEFRNDSFSTTTGWPHPLATAERWYLHGDGGLSRTAPVQEEAGSTMTNPDNPSGRAFRNGALLGFELHLNDGTKCSRSYEQWMLGLDLPKSCHHDTNHSEQQRVIYESEPMAEDYYINGPIQADIWIDSTVTEAVVAVQIEEVSNRQSLPITNGQLLASVRAVNEDRSRFLNGEMIQPYHYFTQEKASLLVPGQVVKMQIEIFSTSVIIRKGNKLRVSISPSNQAQGILNYPRQELAEGGVTTIHVSPQHPSSVVFPVVPTSALN